MLHGARLDEDPLYRFYSFGKSYTFCSKTSSILISSILCSLHHFVEMKFQLADSFECSIRRGSRLMRSAWVSRRTHTEHCLAEQRISIIHTPFSKVNKQSVLCRKLLSVKIPRSTTAEILLETRGVRSDCVGCLLLWRSP